MNAYVTMSYPPSSSFYALGQEYEVPTTRPPYPSIVTSQPPYQMAFAQPSPYPFEQPSPAQTSPAYTPAPYIMQYLSPGPSQHSQSPISPHDYHNNSISRGRAVVIGINYFNQKGELKGSTDEARNLSRYLQQVKHYRKEDIILLSDAQNGPFSQPTKKNILAALIWLAKNAKQGEKLILYYSGHGKVSLKEKKTKGKGKAKATAPGRKGSGTSTQAGAEPDEMETIYPVDFRSFEKGMITPEDLEEILKPAKEKGARLTIILDAHAGLR